MDAITKIKGVVLEGLCEKALLGILVERRKEELEKVLECQTEFKEEIQRWNQSIWVRLFKRETKRDVYDIMDNVRAEMDRRFQNEKTDEDRFISIRYRKESYYGVSSGLENRIKRYVAMGKELPDTEIEIETDVLGSICAEAQKGQ
ncbi:MAG: hypothetical protein M0P12_01230 [Paludibacteraceae bacterium]|nr:hypothetical protein [Paludibacteraceae bacterium]